MSTAISSGPKDFGIMTTQVQLWSVGIIWSTKLRNPPQSGAKRNKSESKCSQNANLASRLALWCSGSDKHCTVDMSTAISSGPKDFGIMTTQVQLCLGRRGINPSQKALKMPFWVADVNGDLFRPQGFRNHDNTGVIVVRGHLLEHRTPKSAAVWGEEE
ncbi:hypothetical protein R3P38DRAFT_2783068 [Favolaschia claudopus]|uniref:Uncharacterized protein n=1 Tax=Favolaschia claudopus TaxID=2862362 RepID=A0AAW0B3V4_9AGAR